MANGILIVDKPAGWTSQDVVAKLRGVFREKRVGHGGTLDPMATGVLPVFFGRATRGVQFFEHAEKAYVAELCLGLTTDTQDSTGTVLAEQSVDITSDQLCAVLSRFCGEQQQIPPMYSAVKIGGKKLYEIARKGKEIERAPRSITIFELKLLDFSDRTARLYIRCSKGTYVRTLCHDIGAALGCGGCMSALRRIQAGAYRESDALPLAEIIAHPAPETLLHPVDSLFFSYPALILTPAQEKCCRNGASFTYARAAAGRYRVYSQAHEFLALGEVSDSKLQTVKSFF